MFDGTLVQNDAINDKLRWYQYRQMDILRASEANKILIRQSCERNIWFWNEQT